MSRYSHVLTKIASSISPSNKIIGIFPFNTLVDDTTTNVHNGQINFLNSGIEGLKALAEKNYSVVLFINQFKGKPLSYEHFQKLNQVVEEFVKDAGVNVIGLYWCPGVDKRDPFVVPNPGMFGRVKENLGISFEGLSVISTSDNDLSAASKAKAMPIKIGNGPSKWTHCNTFYEWAMSAD